MRTHTDAFATLRTLGALLPACLALALAGAWNAWAEEPPRSREDPAIVLGQEEAEMQAAQQRMQELQKRLHAITEELRAPQPSRSIEEIRREYESLVKEIAKQQKQYWDVANRRDEAFAASVRERDERASGLHAAAPAQRIRAGFQAWDDQGQAAARAFCAKHPAFRLFRPDGGGSITSFSAGQIDVLGFTNDYKDHFSTGEREKFGTAFLTPPQSVTIGYWPFAVAVHPGNPIESLSLDQLRTLATNPNATWKDLGRPKDGPIRLYMFDTYHVAKLITGKKEDGNVLSRHQVFNRDWGYMDKTLKAVAEDQDAIFIWHYTARIAGSGLKILPILDSQGTSLLPTDLPAVASGRYVLCTPLTIVIHPQMSEAARHFAQWLTTAEAAEAIEAARQQSRPADVPFLAHVTLAAKDVPENGDSPRHAPPPGRGNPSSGNRGTSATPSEAKIAAAAAVMPTEALSMYFLMARPSHHAAYEQAITDAIAADGRLTLLDRTQLTRVLEEHKLEIEGSKKASSRAIIAADVFVFSYVTSDGSKAYLQIEAIHGPTASLLGDLKLPIDPADPASFNPPLGQAVADWWPHVLEQLVAVRNRPIWTLVGVYAGAIELGETVEAVRDDMEDALSKDSRIFLSRRIPMGPTQEEMLLRLMGLSRPEGGRLSPAADYLIEARLPTSDRIELRLRGVDLAVLDQAEIVESDRACLTAGVCAWLSAHVAKRAARSQPSADLSPPSPNDWARAQARLEYEMGKQQEVNASKRHNAERHYRRAAQLDPTWEEAAYAAVRSCASDNWIFSEGVPRDRSFADPIDACERFLKGFPNSQRAQQVLADYTGGCMNLARKGKVPPGLDERTTRLKYYRKGLEGCRQYIAQYTLQGKHSSDWSKFMPRSYLYWLQGYIDLADPSEKECQAIIEDWSRSYDTHLDQTSHSDFVRLMILAQKKDRPGFVALLTKMQLRWPDPKHPQWEDLQTAQLVRDMLYSLFYDRGGGNSFELWLAGKRGIGDLPRPGYDPKGTKEAEGTTR